MLFPALLALLAAADANQPVRVLVLDTRAEANFLPYVKDFGDLFATILEQRTSAEIIPASSIRDRLQVAAAKVETGCDDTACMTELAGAMDARWVVASRAAQVGGRWLMRVELFDSQDLKVIAQVSAMADSVQGLAAQAESLADQLLAKAPMLRPGASSSSSSPTNAATVTEVPPPDAKRGGLSPGLLIGGGIGAVLLSPVAMIAGFYGIGDVAGKQGTLGSAKFDYQADPASRQNRQRLVEAANDVEGAAMLNNCVFAPLGLLSMPLCFGGLGTIGWGAVVAVTDKGGEE